MGERVLDVPYVSQLGIGASAHRNDCGPACCSMCVAAVTGDIVTPDEWYKLDGWERPDGDGYTNASQLAQGLGIFGVGASTFGFLGASSLKTFIDAGRAMIVLVSYDELSQAGLTHYAGTFMHWVVVAGYGDACVIIHDPYFPDGLGGCFVRVPATVFWAAYRSICIVITQRAGETMVETNGSVKAINGLNVRATPPVDGKLGKLTTTVPHRARVYYDRELDGWLHLTFPMADGWVSAAYIERDPMSAADVPTLDERGIRLAVLREVQEWVEEMIQRVSESANQRGNESASQRGGE